MCMIVSVPDIEIAERNINCLKVSVPGIEIAERDMSCLKVLEILGGIDDNDVIVTPYMFKEVTADMLEGKTPFVTNHPEIKYDFNVPNTRDHMHYMITEGYIHTYVLKSMDRPEIYDMTHDIECKLSSIGKIETFLTPKHAKDIKNCREFPMVTGIVIYRCIIPKGTEYIKGLDDLYYLHCYASREIVFKEKLAEWRTSDAPMLEQQVKSIFELNYEDYENRD